MSELISNPFVFVYTHTIKYVQFNSLFKINFSGICYTSVFILEFFKNVYFLCRILKTEHGHGFHILFLFVILIFFLGLKTITCRDTLCKGILKIKENIKATKNAKLGLPTTATLTHSDILNSTGNLLSLIS